MDGDLAPLAALRELANRHSAYLVIDEAHATGVLGPAGRGLAAALGVRADVHIATLSKALGAFGAYVVGERPLIDYLINRARSLIFTTALPPGFAAAATAAIALAAGAEGEARRVRLRRHIEHVAKGLRALHLLAAGAGSTPIFPILVGEDRRAVAATDALLARGIYAQAIRPPTVPPGGARLRFALAATHTDEHIDSALDALAQLRRDNLL